MYTVDKLNAGEQIEITKVSKEDLSEKGEANFDLWKRKKTGRVAYSYEAEKMNIYNKTILWQILQASQTTANDSVLGMRLT